MVPNIFVLRGCLFQAIGRARADGVMDPEARLAAAVGAVEEWAAERNMQDRFDWSDVVTRLQELGKGVQGAPSLFETPNPEPDALPESLEDLVRFAVTEYGLRTMWSANRQRFLERPEESWRAVVRNLKVNGGPDPRPFWLADAIEKAAQTR